MATDPTAPAPRIPTEEQRAVIKHRGQNARMLAGPGTGKTDTLAFRTKDLIETDAVDPQRILLLTFSRLASLELRDRVRRYRDGEIPTPKTLHSYSLSQLRSNKVSTVCGEHIIDSWEMRAFFREDLGARIGITGAAAEKLLLAMQADWRMLKDEDQPLPAERAALEDALRAFRPVFDFTLLDELVYRMKRWAEKQPEFKPPLDHIMVDEYQDLNKCDQALIAILTERSGAELLVCGDDDQSIHRWRQAHASGIRHFLESHGAKPFELTECWRCGQNVVDHSWSVVTPIRGRDSERRKLVSKKAHAGDVRVVYARNPREAAYGLARLVRHLTQVATSATTGEVLVLVPRRDFAEEYATKMAELDVSVVNLVDLAADVDTYRVRDMLALLQLALRREDSVALRTLLKLHGGIGSKRIKPIIDRAIADHLTFFASAHVDPEPIVKEVLDRVARIPQVEPTSTAAEAVAAIAAALEVADDALAEFIATTTKLVGDLGEIDLEQIAAAVREARLAGDPNPAGPNGPVRVMTFRQAKGLSAGVVLVTDLDDEIVPGSDDMDEVEEQRRLLYVSMTRAERDLYLFYCGTRSQHSSAYAGLGSRVRPGQQRTISRFLDELDIAASSIADLVPKPARARRRATTPTEIV